MKPSLLLIHCCYVNALVITTSDNMTVDNSSQPATAEPQEQSSTGCSNTSSSDTLSASPDDTLLSNNANLSSNSNPDHTASSFSTDGGVNMSGDFSGEVHLASTDYGNYALSGAGDSYKSSDSTSSMAIDCADEPSDNYSSYLGLQSSDSSSLVIDSSAASTGSLSSPVTGSNSESCKTTGRLTYNNFSGSGPGSSGGGACTGGFYSDSQLVIALATPIFNGGSNCGKEVTIRYGGKSVKAVVVDECASSDGCPANALDASKGVWNVLGINLDLGIIDNVEYCL